MGAKRTDETYMPDGLRILSVHSALSRPIRACGLAGVQVARGKKKISYEGYRFPLEVIQQAIRIYVQFTLSIRDVEDLLAKRGIMVPYETVRRWVNREAGLPSSDLLKIHNCVQLSRRIEREC